MLRRVWLLFFMLLLFWGMGLRAQEDSSIGYGTIITGALDNRTPRSIYYFEGERCERIAVHVRATSGNLDPVLLILNNSGELVARRDDSPGSRDADIEALAIPQTDRYYVVVGRFGFGRGSTAGEYELSIERLGVGSSSGCMLRYGDAVQNIISNQEPKFFYGFRARAGDILNIEMQRGSGSLDPYLQVVNSQQRIIASNDDWVDTNDSRIDSLLIEEDGIYIIIASRYGQENGSSSGSFVLSVDRAVGSGLGNSPRAAVPLRPGEVQSDVLTDQQTVKYYTFQAQRDDIVTIRMDRDGGRLDPLVRLANAGLQELTADDDSGENKNARIERYMIPADGLYYIIATRFEGEESTPTIGRYTLQLIDEGNAFDGVPQDIPRLIYGTTVTGTIDDENPQSLYAFWGAEDDVVSVTLTRGDGNLDPLVSILNSDLRPLVSDDDSATGQNAYIERYRIPVSGVYYIRAARYSGPDSPSNTRGSYTLVLARRVE